MQRVGTWTETYEQLTSANTERKLEPKELETLALAAYLTGRDAECFRSMELAHKGYLDRGKMEQAVRSAFWLGLMFKNAGETARSGGWMAKGERLLNDAQLPDCAEQGLLLLLPALQALSKDPGKAQKLFEQIATIGSRFGDADLIALGRLGHGQALIQQGDIATGKKLLDETMITVETEDVYPVINGIVYCAVIDTCQKVWDLERAQEWTSALTRWCAAQPDIIPFRGECLVRRAEIIQLHGEWTEALEETHGACALLTRRSTDPAAGEAHYRRAELHRLLGNFEDAEDSYQEAAKWGRKPQPGLALLRLAQGQNEVAETAIRNTLQETKDIKKRAALLPAVVRIMIAVNQTDEAKEAAQELDNIADAFDAPYLLSMASHCNGAVLLAEENYQSALEYLQNALKLWNTIHLPYESAHTRVLKGTAYRELNDPDNSDAELAAAKWIFEQLNATPDLERVNQLLNNKQNHESHGLTLRELQILQEVALGKTNKSIAGELFISERTVDRHVSNIFNKLSVSSRVAATTFALKHKLLDNQEVG